MVKRRVKVWGKMNLYETSVVGIPAYPDAHSSVESFSLVKALNANTRFVNEEEDISEKLNLEERETMEESQKSIDVEVAKIPIVEEKSETKEIKTAETDMSEIIAKAIKEGIKDGLKELEIERGVVEKQIPVKKSLGEMAIEQGLFVK
jgi:hypothetical protein